MPSQKLPLFDGIIQPIQGGLVTPVNNLIFAKQSNPQAPRTYEVHLWLIPQSSANVRYTVVASEGPYATAVKKAEVWSGRATSPLGGFPFGSKPIKILDGYPLRGDVQLSLDCTGTDAAFPVGAQMFGYFHQVGAGTPESLEHRFIGDKTLSAFNAGVPLNLVIPVAPGSSPSEILHVFEPNRIDEISLALGVSGDSETDQYGAVLTFEDVNNQPLIPGHAVVAVVSDVASNAAFAAGSPAGAPNSNLGQPGINSPLSSPYFFKDIPFGGNAQLHHIRVRFASVLGGPAVGSAHGYFVRH